MPGTEEIVLKCSPPRDPCIFQSATFCPGLPASSPSVRLPVLGTLLGLMDAQGTQKGKLAAQGDQGSCEEPESVSGLLVSAPGLCLTAVQPG